VATSKSPPAVSNGWRKILAVGGKDAQKALDRLRRGGITDGELEDRLGAVAVPTFSRRVSASALLGLSRENIRALARRLKDDADRLDSLVRVFRSIGVSWEAELELAGWLREEAARLDGARAEYVQRYNRYARNGANLTTDQEVILIDAVKAATGRPHFDDLVTLLAATFEACGLDAARYRSDDPVRALSVRYRRFKRAGRSPITLLDANRLDVGELLRSGFFARS
jgi:hypothetical protein